MGISPNDFKLSSIIDIHGFQYIIQKQLDFINIELVVHLKTPISRLWHTIREQGVWWEYESNL